MFNALLPKGAPFFELLLQQNKILCSVATALAELLENNTGIDKPHRGISLLEEEADSIHLAITKHLSLTFITPIDREDILHINKTQEEAIDLIRNTANRLYIFEFSYVRFPMLQLARNLKLMAQLTKSMLEGLSQKRDSHNTKVFWALRNECEMLLSMGLGELHDIKEPAPADILNILKWTQAYDRMEMAVNQVTALAESIEEAVLKNV